MADIAKFIEEIKGMTVVELNELVKALEEEFGVSSRRCRSRSGREDRVQRQAEGHRR